MEEEFTYQAAHRSLLLGGMATADGSAATPDAAAAPSVRPGQRFPPIIDIHAHPMLPGVHVPPGVVVPEWSVELLLKTMDRFGIDATILSVPSASMLPAGPEGAAKARSINEQIAGLVARAPSRLGGLATLPFRDPDSTLREIDYAFDTLKLDGALVNAHIDGQYLGEPMFDPWMTELDRRQATLFVHPFPPAAMSGQPHPLDPVILEVPFETTRMIVNMVASGAKARFPNIAMIAVHGGGTLPFVLDRILESVPDYGLGKDRPFTVEAARAGFASFYYDLALATSRSQIVGVTGLVPSSHIVLGFDRPAAPDTTVPSAIAALAEAPEFNAADVVAIAHGNAARLFPHLAARMQKAKNG